MPPDLSPEATVGDGTSSPGPSRSAGSLVDYAISGVAFVLAAVALRAQYAIMGQFRIHPDDTFHLVLGRWIVEHRAFPRQDFISWTARGRPLYQANWLYQVVLAEFHRAGGWAAVLTAQYLIALLGVAVLFALLFARTRGEWWATGVVFVAALAVSAANPAASLQERPQTGAIILLMLLCIVLERGGRVRLLLAAIVCLLAAQWHDGLWPLFALPLAYYGARDREWTLALPILAFGLGPDGPRGMLNAIEYARDSAVYTSFGGSGLDEWVATLRLSSLGSSAANLLAIAAPWGVVAWRRRGVRVLDIVALAALTVYALRFERGLIVMPFLAYPLIASYVPQLIGAEARSRRAALSLAAVLVLALAVGSVTTRAVNLAGPAALGGFGPQQARQEAREAQLRTVGRYLVSKHLSRPITPYGPASPILYYESGVTDFIDDRGYVFVTPSPDRRGTVISDYSEALAAGDPDLLVREYHPDSAVFEGTLPRPPLGMMLAGQVGIYAVYVPIGK